MVYRVASIGKYIGFGTSVIAKLVKSNVKKNLFYTMKERVVEETIISGMVNRKKQLVKIFGFDSSKNGRAELFELVSDRVRYHKDKVIEPRIYEELCALRMTPKGRIDHPDNGHDDLVIAWALALYVLYRGGDIANVFGIERHQYKTDEQLDEEIYDVNRDAEIITEQIDTADLNEEAQVEQQLKVLDQSPGKMSWEEWRKSEFKREQEALNKILTNKDAREAYVKQNHLNPDDYTQPALTTLPDELFTTNYYDKLEKSDTGVGRGNLFSQYMRVMSR